MKELKITNAKYFLPYAGNFDEKLTKNEYIRKNNQKNTIQDYMDINSNFLTLNIHEYNEFEFYDGKLQNQNKIKNIEFQDLEKAQYQ